MATSSITITALTATPTLRGNKLAAVVSATGPAANIPPLMLANVEFYGSTVDVFSIDNYIGEGNPDFLHTGLIEEQTYYYWAIPRAVNGDKGAQYPVSPTAGVACTAIGQSGLAFGLANGKLVPSVAGNALTIAVKTAAGNDPDATAAGTVFAAFRNSTLATGNYQIRQITSALSLTISSGSTMGAVSGAAFRLWIVLFDDAGTLRLGAINCTGSAAQFTLDESLLRSSTAEGGAGAADSLGVIYTGTAVASKPFRIIGFMTWNSGLATAGTWNATPDLVQLFGPGVKKPGEQIQYIENLSTTATKVTGTFSSATGVPPNTEGSQLFSTDITPTSPANWLVHDVLINADSTPGNFCVVALFQDSTVNAIAASGHRASPFSADAVVPIPQPLRHRQLAGTTSTISFKIRGGTFTGPFVMNTLYVDSTNTLNTLLGGTVSSGHRMLEIMG